MVHRVLILILNFYRQNAITLSDIINYIQSFNNFSEARMISV